MNENSVLGSSTWLIRVAAPGDPRAWDAKLNASVAPYHGCFQIEEPTEEELRRVESGELATQKRTLKRSALVYRDVIQNGGL